MTHTSYAGLAGRVVLITGGASGIGAAFVRAFATQKAQVAFLDIDADAGAALARDVGSQCGAAPLFVPCDLLDIAALRSAIAEVRAALGDAAVLVNNAANDQRHTIEEVTPEYWDRSMATNLRPQFFMVQAVLPGMKAAGRGSIINMSSISWMIPSTGMPLYIAAKAAIVGLTRTLAHELGPSGIRVNAVLPGGIFTERQQRLWFTPELKAEIRARQALKHEIQPDEVARLALFLAADDASAITNQSYIVDGGWV